ncbi:MAG TPA: type VI secretion system protein TssA [Bryobacteraceae bacterium]|jgi:type VI secretion system protein ImpA|nr:type VI secretion system protein TssA [Bryobacteraceae bacterium]
MPIDIPALLLPIPGESPSGSDLRYHAVTEKIKEARRQEEDISQGVWKHEIKTANYPLALKLSTEALTKQSKDLQVAAWVTEALANLEGYNGLRQGLELIRGLLENFWDSVYPQIDDGDLDLRSMPLSWIGTQLGPMVRSAPILKGGYNWYSHRSSRSIPTEEQAQIDPAKLAARTEALAEGEVSPEDFEKAFESTPFEAMKACYAEITGLSEYLESLNELCKEKFSDQSPDFGPLQLTLEEVGGVVRVLFKTKESLEAPREVVTEAPPPEEQPVTFFYPQETAQETMAPAAPVRRPTSTSPEPSSVEDAMERIFSCAQYLRGQEPGNPVPYLVTRAVRWGEVWRSQGSQEAAAAPPSQLRMDLKHLAAQGSWDALREAAEDAAAGPCGGAWLDLQRYSVESCRYTGCYAPANAIVSGLRALLADFPDLPKSMLADDTPAANAETVQWLANENITPSATAAPAAVEEWKFTPDPSPARDPDNNAAPAPPDSYDLAIEAARSGRIDEAIEILALEIAREQSGRARFLRRTQLAQVCVAAGNEAIGRPVLQDLSDEIVTRGLEGWETSEVISQPLALLYRCLNGEDVKEKEKLYARICKLDPLRALRLVR